jgi:hypothetical protein
MRERTHKYTLRTTYLYVYIIRLTTPVTMRERTVKYTPNYGSGNKDINEVSESKETINIDNKLE